MRGCVDDRKQRISVETGEVQQQKILGLRALSQMFTEDVC